MFERPHLQGIIKRVLEPLLGIPPLINQSFYTEKEKALNLEEIERF